MDILEKYYKDLKVSGRSETTIRNQRYFLEKLNRLKPVLEWSKEDIDRYLFEVSEKAGSRSTVEFAKTTFRSFYKRMGQFEKIKHIEIKMIEGTLRRDDILSAQDVDKLISITESPLFKALFAILFESGARISEVLSCKVSDVLDKDGRMFLTVHQTKYGMDKRRVLCLSSAQYIRNLINYLNLSKEDYLFKSNRGDRPLDKSYVEKTFKKLGIKAGIEKPVNPHNFRHSCATNLVLQGYQDALIKKGLGWKQASRAINRYQHIVDDDFINARLEKEGQIESKENELPKLGLVEPIQKVDDKTLLRKLAVENEESKKENEALKEQLKDQQAQNEFIMKALKAKGII